MSIFTNKWFWVGALFLFSKRKKQDQTPTSPSLTPGQVDALRKQVEAGQPAPAQNMVVHSGTPTGLKTRTSALP